MDILIAFLFVAALIGVHAYFHSRRHLPPSKVERGLAMLWLVIRRLLCFSMALLFWGGAAYMGYLVLTRAASPSLLWWSAGLLPFGYIFLHLGLYGAGYKRYDWNEDKSVHAEHKRRYGWRW
ncbi:hypothetical protein [Xanthomonas arboricola]|uniref:hypothetical protein n=1 Tax=Xanthomonas arboricola TaxID=56448 RepID=UPI001290202B|nr:hypothetical protein [Xanthomonas arboricola]